MMSQMNDEKGTNLAIHGLAKFMSAVNGFGNLSDEEVAPDQQAQRAAVPMEICYSGAQSLAASHTPCTSPGKHNQANKNEAHASHEDTQSKMKILMESPRLWLQFKSKLASSTSGSGCIGVQAVLREFLADHPEVEAQLVKEQKKAESKRLEDLRNIRRISLLQTVSILTAELSSEAADRSIDNRRRPSMVSQSSNVSQESSPSTNKNGSFTMRSAKNGSFMRNASELLGMSFLKKAADLVSASLGDSSSSQTDFDLNDSETSLEVSPAPIKPKPRLRATSGLFAFNEKDEDGYV
jgi:hypothetical protein